VVEQPDLQQIWEEVLTLVQPISTQVMLRQQCLLLGFDQQQAKIGARSQQLFKMAQQRLPNVEAAFAQLCDRPIRVSLEVVTSTPPAPPSPAPAPAATAAAVPSRTPKAVVRETAPASPSSFSGDRTAAPAAKSTPPPADYPAESAISPAPVLPTTWEAEDEVSRSAKALAQFFNGQVVSLEADEQPLSATDLSRLQTDMDLEEADGDPDHDVPF
jgi:DNA polymerase-3 subunit gamma/tau